MKYGTNIDVIKPEKIQYINNKLIDRLELFREKKSIIVKLININEGIISLDIPSQYF